MYYSYVEIEYVATGFSPTRTDLALKLLINDDDYNALQKQSLMLFDGFCIFGFRDFYKNMFCILVEVNKTKYGNNEDIPKNFLTLFTQTCMYVMLCLWLCGMSLQWMKKIVSIDRR